MAEILRGSIVLALTALVLAGCNNDSDVVETVEVQGADEDERTEAEAGEDGQIPAPDDVAAPPSDAERTESGLASKVLEPGDGPSPDANDRVTVHYTGWTTDGEMFDSSVTRGRPATFPLDGVIAGWTEGLQLMKTGEKRRFWIPQDLAYHGRPGAPAGMLVFDVELINVSDVPNPPPPPPPAEVPEDVAGPPADAERTDSGLASKVLEPGTGTEHPTPQSRVQVHYTGWTTDGKMFDSSITRGRPATFPLNRVIAGWTEGLQLMVEGEKRRFWIPADLAYGDNPRPGAPSGML
ncbi:MAG: peptidylprolyl isomerase, partial [Actinobacteria bacterium]|nr:peptidylprolyl isomerase [Actinomycetota bacterium]NIU21056.1 peptidylprolyl isomerase [Actinomycetota bacterium]NIU64760.1 peptidylprolyl isomerase [Actinomycetota bacterium]NIV54603.1 peptidylprolyl isomerase [Actinomycetota bacterium]NIW26559.1 peptidylprolyl isomerase [Actinomycetota bacterium]